MTNCVYRVLVRFRVERKHKKHKTMSKNHKKLAKQRKVWTAEARSLIFAVKNHFLAESWNTGPLVPITKVNKRTAAALNIPQGIVSKLIKGQLRVMESTKKPVDQNKKIEQLNKLEPFQRDFIRQHIYSYYESKKLPTIKQLSKSLKDENFIYDQETLLYIINNIGFRTKTYKGKKIVFERPIVAEKRHDFLKEIKDMDFSKVFFTGATTVDVNLDQRIVIFHGASRSGCISYLTSRRKDIVNIYFETYKKWFEEDLIPNIPLNCTIILDDAPYLRRQINKPPTFASKRTVICNWLYENNLIFNQDSRKAELLELVELFKPSEPSYVLDEIAKRNGHRVLRLPPHHYIYNSSNIIWDKVKDYVKMHIKPRYKAAKVEKLLKKGINEVSSEHLTHIMMVIEKRMKNDWHRDGTIEDNIDTCIDELRDKGSSSEDTDFSEYSDTEDEVEIVEEKPKLVVDLNALLQFNKIHVAAKLKAGSSEDSPSAITIKSEPLEDIIVKKEDISFVVKQEIKSEEANEYGPPLFHNLGLPDIKPIIQDNSSSLLSRRWNANLEQILIEFSSRVKVSLMKVANVETTV